VITHQLFDCDCPFDGHLLEFILIHVRPCARPLRVTEFDMAGRNERTFIMIKPDGVQRGLIGEIIKRFEQKGFTLKAMKFIQVRGRTTWHNWCANLCVV